MVKGMEAVYMEALERRVAALEQENEELKQRLDTARKTAWMAVPIAAHLVMEGDLVAQKDGTLARVLEAEHSMPDAPRGEGYVTLQLESGGTRRNHRLRADRPVPVLRRPTEDALRILTDGVGAQPA